MNKYVIHWKFIGPSGPQLLGHGAPPDCPTHKKMHKYVQGKRSVSCCEMCVSWPHIGCHSIYQICNPKSNKYQIFVYG